MRKFKPRNNDSEIKGYVKMTYGAILEKIEKCQEAGQSDLVFELPEFFAVRTQAQPQSELQLIVYTDLIEMLELQQIKVTLLGADVTAGQVRVSKPAFHLSWSVGLSPRERERRATILLGHIGCGPLAKRV